MAEQRLGPTEPGATDVAGPIMQAEVLRARALQPVESQPTRAESRRLPASLLG